MRIVTHSLLALSISLSVNLQAIAELDSATEKQLEQLEQQYFQHNYDNDSDAHRTKRLEEFVFGEASDGDLADRIKKLATAATPGIDADKNTNAAASSSTSAPTQTYSQPEQTATNSNQSYDDPSDVPDDTADNYPKVTVLEQAILGQSYVGQHLSNRLARMETKAFGKTSNSTDLSDRTDALSHYAEQTLHKSVEPKDPDDTTQFATLPTSHPALSQAGAGQMDSTQTSTNQVDDNDTSPDPSVDYPRITTLEQAILGKTYITQSPLQRLDRLEVKAFGKESTNDDLSQRTDSLEKYTEKKLHKKTLQDKQEQADAANGGSGSGDNSQQGSQRAKQIASMAANTLLGLAGMGGMGMMPGFGPGIMPGYGYGPGYGMYGGGMGRRGMQNNSQQKQDDEPKTRPEDPAVYAPTPPPTSARLITKIGWCEVQVFGQTYPTMHLEERLDQLNDELKFAPGQSNTALMDKIGILMNSIMAKKQAANTNNKAISTKQQTPTQ